MMEAVLPAAGLAYSGLALLCLGMHRHERQVRRTGLLSPRGRVLSRLGGWGLLAASLLPLLSLQNPGITLVAGIGVLTPCAGVLVLGLAYAPRLVVPAASGGAALALLAWLMR